MFRLPIDMAIEYTDYNRDRLSSIYLDRNPIDIGDYTGFVDSIFKRLDLSFRTVYFLFNPNLICRLEIYPEYYSVDEYDLDKRVGWTLGKKYRDPGLVEDPIDPNIQLQDPDWQYALDKIRISYTRYIISKGSYAQMFGESRYGPACFIGNIYRYSTGYEMYNVEREDPSIPCFDASRNNLPTTVFRFDDMIDTQIYSNLTVKQLGFSPAIGRKAIGNISHYIRCERNPRPGATFMHMIRRIKPLWLLSPLIIVLLLTIIVLYIDRFLRNKKFSDLKRNASSVVQNSKVDGGGSQLLLQTSTDNVPGMESMAIVGQVKSQVGNVNNKPTMN